jgi:hypothetical protein
VTGPIRRVRPTRQFYADLRQQLGAERGQAGEPSQVDFELHDLIMILETFTNDWDTLPRLIPGRDDYRVLIAPGVLVYAYAVQAALARDGVVELLSLEIDTTWSNPDPDADLDADDSADGE